MRIVGGKYRGKKILPPHSKDTRPTSDRAREMIFNILLHNPSLGPSVLQNKAVLDVCAGTGALGLEALSRGAASLTCIENNREVLPILRRNLEAFKDSPTSILEKDVRHLGKASTSFDLVFLDPPYGQNLIPLLLSHLASGVWLSQDAILVIEAGKQEEISVESSYLTLTDRVAGIAKLTFLKYVKI